MEELPKEVKSKASQRKQEEEASLEAEGVTPGRGSQESQAEDKQGAEETGKAAPKVLQATSKASAAKVGSEISQASEEGEEESSVEIDLPLEEAQLGDKVDRGEVEVSRASEGARRSCIKERREEVRHRSKSKRRSRRKEKKAKKKQKRRSRSHKVRSRRGKSTATASRGRREKSPSGGLKLTPRAPSHPPPGYLDQPREGASGSGRHSGPIPAKWNNPHLSRETPRDFRKDWDTKGTRKRERQRDIWKYGFDPQRKDIRRRW